MKQFRFLASFVVVIFLIQFSLFSQTTTVYPTNWWVGMKWNKVQLMLHDTTGLASDKVVVAINYPGVKLLKVNKANNRNYLFLDVEISPLAKPGIVTINVSNLIKKDNRTIKFELKTRRTGRGKQFAQGVYSSDFIYLLMPDRFSNGDPSNDHVADMLDQSLNRDSIYDRHGGDLQGVINHLDHLQELGVTALWMTPVIENDMPRRTEHGYAFTDHYKIDPRLGGETAYKKLSDALHSRGMKLIQDAVYNHIGLNHFLFKDKPFKDWFNEWPTFTNPNYKDQTHFDPYASAIDKRKMDDSWFAHQMPDLNQSNPYVANFLIQHALWSVEEYGVDGWRIDTYIYVDQPFMIRCNKALIDEYPAITMFGEVWVTGTANQAYFTRNNFNIPFKSNLTGLCDFQTLFDGIIPSLKQPNDGVNKLYNVLSNDFMYKDPTNNIIFLDNHDMSRFLTEMNGDTAKLKIGLAWLLTCRGIPELYYGTEILMKGERHPYDGNVRLDFTGGWKEDAANNKFTIQGRTAEENSIFNYTKALGNFRLKSSAIKTGKLMQYVPENGVYVYFRYDDKQTVMCIMNSSNKPVILNTTRFRERIKTFTNGVDVTTGKTFSIKENIEVPASYEYVLDLK
ncbi:glycoside hydrolase family 13 protein [soil metagenome]